LQDNLYAIIPIVVKRTAPTTNRWGSTAKATQDR